MYTYYVNEYTHALSDLNWFSWKFMQLGIYYPHENEHMLINSKVPECIINAINKEK